ncbi:MAG TPA: glycosyltransferase [Ktedonobacteraceae bacterium]
MKILALSPHIPAPMAGASTRDYYLLKALASQHEVTLLTLDESVIEGVARNTGDLKQFVKGLQIIESGPALAKRQAQLQAALSGQSYLLSRSILPQMQEAIDAAFSRETFDAVFCESIMLTGYRLPPDVALVIDEHNLEYELCWRTYRQTRPGLRKLYSWLEARKLQPEELKRCRAASQVLVTSERELLELKRLAPASVIALVPNGVDTLFFQPPDPAEEKEQSIIYTGAMDYYPNTDAVLQFASVCWPGIKARLPGATWMIVGKNPPPQVQRLGEFPGVTVTGSVVDVRPYLAQAALAIAPLRIGSGTRLKILEAFAMQKAVVSSKIGCEGLKVTDKAHLLVADEPDHFIHAVVELLEDASARERLGQAGRKLAESEYSWDASGQRLIQALATLQIENRKSE